MRRAFLTFCCVMSCVSLYSVSVVANTSDNNELTTKERVSLARSFVSKIKGRLNQYERVVQASQPNILPDGEFLFLQPVMGKNFRPEAFISARVENQKLLLSLRDFVDSLEIAIRLSEDGKNAAGWYIQEGFPFKLVGDSREVNTAEGSFRLSRDVLFEGSDVWIPSEELAQWLGFDFDVVVSAQELKIISDLNLPIYAKFLRNNVKIQDNYRRAAASLPLGGEKYGLVSAPVVDVSTNSSIRHRKGANGTASHGVNFRTSSDFALGTLKTQSSFNNRDQLALARATYSQDSLEGDLLGPLKAKRLEIGDISTTRVPYGPNVEQELGVRVTNTSAVRGFSRATTAISGTALPGWDVELYRGNQLLGLKVVGDDGFYEFSNVDLFQNDSNFRLVFYGLQGVVREESVFVPFDKNLLGQGDGIYDVSVTLDEKNSFTASRLASNDTDNKGSLSVSALYEKPIMPGLTSTLGLRSAENSLGERDTLGSVGLSATVKEVLLNASAAMDDDSGLATSLTARRNFGDHEVATGLNWSNSGLLQQNSNSGALVLGGSGGFASDAEGDSYGASFRLDGPVPFADALNVRYGANGQYNINSNGGDRLALNGSFSGGYKRVSFGGGVNHEEDNSRDYDRTNAFASLSGSQGRNRLRFNANYEIEPQSELQSVSASYNRRFSNKLDTALNVTQQPEADLTTYQARLDWQAGFIRLSPSVSYDSDQNFFAGLNTRFGLIHDPSSKQLKVLDRNVTNFGLVSAFVYLDKNGDGLFNGDDEPLPDVTVIAPQNSRQLQTDANGIALFNNMTRLRLTDVFVAKDSLKDPAWIPGFEGVSILPREGYVAQIDFPIHSSGEIDGTVYANVVSSPDAWADSEGSKALPVALRNMKLKLYNDKGEVEQTVTTDLGGFYYFAQIPPGRYFMILDEESATLKNVVRPRPQPIEIGYDGTVIYGNDIYVDTGAGDVPAEIMADLEAYKAQHPHVDFHPEMHDVVLNLGEYNSRLLMSVVWYKLKSRYAPVLGAGELFVPPTQSYADLKTGKHALRVGLGDSSLDEAYGRCRALMARQQYCKVEIYPAAMKKASLD